jgi:hypothetical protein
VNISPGGSFYISFTLFLNRNRLISVNRPGTLNLTGKYKLHVITCKLSCPFLIEKYIIVDSGKALKYQMSWLETPDDTGRDN